MKKIISSLAMFAFIMSFAYFGSSEVDAQSLSYKTTVVFGSDGCMYQYCTNNAGNDCNSPGSAFKVCPTN